MPRPSLWAAWKVVAPHEFWMSSFCPPTKLVARVQHPAGRRRGALRAYGSTFPPHFWQDWRARVQQRGCKTFPGTLPFSVSTSVPISVPVSASLSLSLRLSWSQRIVVLSRPARGHTGGRLGDKRGGWARSPNPLEACACTRSGRGPAEGTGRAGRGWARRGRAEGRRGRRGGTRSLGRAAGTRERTAAA